MSLLTAIFGLFSCNAQSDKFKTVDVEEFAKVISGLVTSISIVNFSNILVHCFISRIGPMTIPSF